MTMTEVVLNECAKLDALQIIKEAKLKCFIATGDNDSNVAVSANVGWIILHRVVEYLENPKFFVALREYHRKNATHFAQFEC